ncbi:FecR family protein [Chitinophaga sp. sic0106]|uniref:FecR family protein n=1 Tax=Chitinophaga sp. sic0106 TaxID=2854785 RepID=UPI001C48018B|nr:FecR family protein [Chitinophaga sp. sic0106]MBV7528597.1 FecR domain-containing protein [Chitinophaga sp. sic0106]
MTKEQLNAFLKDYTAGNYSEQDYLAFRHWLDNAAMEEKLAVLDKYSDQFPDLAAQPSADARRVAMIEAALDESTIEALRKPARVLNIRRWSAAAAAVLLLGTGAWWLHKESKSKPATVAQHVNVAPGKAGAILTLGDGSQLVLDSAGNGVIAIQNGVNIVLDSGKIGYGKDQLNGEPQVNTLSTPIGRQFKVVLPDGTLVWLNAASSIQYPTYFAGNNREVTVTGEVYLQVATDQNHPFRVTIMSDGHNEGTVDVLGTDFNINAYPNENATKVTLISGAVMVSAGSPAQKETLRPDQQAAIHENSKITIQHVNTDNVTAWKNGYFDFDENDLTMLMRQLTRWYGIETEIGKNVPVDIQFGGKISRNLMLSEVIKVLNQAGVHCYLTNERKLMVMP